MDDAVGMQKMKTLGSITGPLQPLGEGDGSGGGGRLAEMLSEGASGHVLDDEAFFGRISDELQEPVVLWQFLSFW
jgi:hypothetical protein